MSDLPRPEGREHISKAEEERRQADSITSAFIPDVVEGAIDAAVDLSEPAVEAAVEAGGTLLEGATEAVGGVIVSVLGSILD